MFFNKDETEIRKLVTFYSIYTAIYFPLLLIFLKWTDLIYLAGKYKFNSVISLILFAELLKYFSSMYYFKTHDVSLGKKYDEKTTGFIVKSIFTKAKIREGIKNVLVILIMVLIFSVIAILFGAEVFSRYEETIMFSGLLSVLTVLPVCMNLGSQSVVSLIFGSKPINNLEVLLYQNFYLSVLGAWIGAFVIPLDWDRPWQVWPIPCSLGAMVGFTLSHFVMMFKVKIGTKRKGRRNI